MTLQVCMGEWPRWEDGNAENLARGVGGEDLHVVMSTCVFVERVGEGGKGSSMWVYGEMGLVRMAV